MIWRSGTPEMHESDKIQIRSLNFNINQKSKTGFVSEKQKNRDLLFERERDFLEEMFIFFDFQPL